MSKVLRERIVAPAPYPRVRPVALDQRHDDGGRVPPFLGPYAAAKAADSLAVTISCELTRSGIETSIVVPGAFTRGTEHFPTSGGPADEATVSAYDCLANSEGLWRDNPLDRAAVHESAFASLFMRIIL